MIVVMTEKNFDYMRRQKDEEAYKKLISKKEQKEKESDVLFGDVFAYMMTEAKQAKSKGS